MKRLITILVMLVLIGGVFTACNAVSGVERSQEGDLQITDAWARPGQAGGTSAVYFVIENKGEEETLLRAACDAAGMTELHMSKMEGDTMKMQPQENVPLASGEKTEFKPGGLHVMLMNLKEDVSVGDTLTVTLTFDKAGTIEVQAPVREP